MSGNGGVHPPPSGAGQVKVDFMIVGAQKCGTTALARFLSRHPEIDMPPHKEVHLFDSPQYSSSWTPEQINERYRAAFNAWSDAVLRGEATPLYMFLPGIAGELRRYNPDLKLIVMLRDPVERAISSYYMEKDRGNERLPLWLALLMEPFRLRRCRDVRNTDSPVRRQAYRKRGLYSFQLRNLYRFFDRDRVLVINMHSLLHHHDATLRRVFAFLGVSVHVRIAPGIILPDTPRKGERGPRTHPVVSSLLRMSYRAEAARLRALLPHAPADVQPSSVTRLIPAPPHTPPPCP